MGLDSSESACAPHNSPSAALSPNVPHHPLGATVELKPTSRRKPLALHARPPRREAPSRVHAVVGPPFADTTPFVISRTTALNLQFIANWTIPSSDEHLKWSNFTSRQFRLRCIPIIGHYNNALSIISRRNYHDVFRSAPTIVANFAIHVVPISDAGRSISRTRNNQSLKSG